MIYKNRCKNNQSNKTNNNKNQNKQSETKSKEINVTVQKLYSSEGFINQLELD